MASEIRNRFTDTEMQIARETDLPELLSHLGYQVKRVGRFHTTTEMDSLRIKDRRTWFRYSQNTGGDAITFLQQFCGKSFPEAVEYLLTFHGKARDAPAPEPKPISQKPALSLPPRNADDRRVFAYLRKRGIAAQVIRQFLNAGLLYEDAVHHNCVFVGRDESGQAKYAGLRGTYDLDSPGFKGDATGSDKNTGFSLPHDPRSDLDGLKAIFLYPLFSTAIRRSAVLRCVWTRTSLGRKPPSNYRKSISYRGMPLPWRNRAAARIGTSICKERFAAGKGGDSQKDIVFNADKKQKI